MKFSAQMTGFDFTLSTESLSTIIGEKVKIISTDLGHTKNRNNLQI